MFVLFDLEKRKFIHAMELNSLYIKKFDFLALNIIHWGEKSSNQDIIAISFLSSCEIKENDISMQINLLNQDLSLMLELRSATQRILRKLIAYLPFNMINSG